MAYQRNHRTWKYVAAILDDCDEQGDYQDDNIERMTYVLKKKLEAHYREKVFRQRDITAGHSLIQSAEEATDNSKCIIYVMTKDIRENSWTRLMKDHLYITNRIVIPIAFLDNKRDISFPAGTFKHIQFSGFTDTFLLNLYDAMDKNSGTQEDAADEIENTLPNELNVGSNYVRKRNRDHPRNSMGIHLNDSQMCLVVLASFVVGLLFGILIMK